MQKQKRTCQLRTFDQFVLLFVSDEDEADDDDDDDDVERSSFFSFVADGWLTFEPLAMVKDVSRSSSNGLVNASSRPAMVINSPKLENKKGELTIM